MSIPRWLRLAAFLLLVGCGAMQHPGSPPEPDGAPPRPRAIITISGDLGWNGLAFQGTEVSEVTSTQTAGLAWYKDGRYQTGPVDSTTINQDQGTYRGFWLFATDRFTLAYTAEDGTRPHRLDLVPGWNLAGFGNSADLPGSSVEAWVGSEKVGLGTVVLPQASAIRRGGYDVMDFGAGGTIMPGVAYWVFASRACQLRWPEASPSPSPSPSASSSPSPAPSPSASPIRASLPCLTYTGTTLVAAGTFDRIVTSTDGMTWRVVTENSSPVPRDRALRGLASGNGRVVAVGDAGTVLTSPDARTWTTSSAGVQQNLNAACFGQNQFVAVGTNGTIVVTPVNDAPTLSWTTQTSGTERTLLGVAFDGSAFTACGAGGTILRSADGKTWMPQVSGTDADLMAITFANNRLVAVGSRGTVATSSAAGGGWSVMTSGPTDLYGVAGGGGVGSPGQFVLVGAGGTILTSTDLTRFTARTSGTSNTLRASTFGGGVRVAAGDYDGDGRATLLTSPDGITWLPATIER